MKKRFKTIVKYLKKKNNENKTNLDRVLEEK